MALKLLQKRVARFQDLRKRTPTDFELYALWNAPTQALTGKISSAVAERSRRFANLCGWNNIPLAVLKTLPPQGPFLATK